MQLFLHIGLIKTGSTYLQRVVFPQLPDDIAVIRPTVWSHPPSTVSTKRALLISNENLAGNPLIEEGRQRSLYDEFAQCIETSISIYESPRFIVGFREPARFIQSVYKQYLHERGVLQWDDFLQLFLPAFGDLRFSRFIDCLEKNVKPENFFVYHQEELLDSEQQIIKSLTRFMGVEENELRRKVESSQENSSVPEQYEHALRSLNKLSSGLRAFTFRHLGLRFGNIVLNPAWLCSRVLPAILGKGVAKRDLSKLEAKYASDWAETKIRIAKHRIEHRIRPE